MSKSGMRGNERRYAIVSGFSRGMRGVRGSTRSTRLSTATNGSLSLVNKGGRGSRGQGRQLLGHNGNSMSDKVGKQCFGKESFFEREMCKGVVKFREVPGHTILGSSMEFVGFLIFFEDR